MRRRARQPNDLKGERVLNLYQKKAKADEGQLTTDYRLTFLGETGQRVLADLIDHCHLFKPSYVSQDPGETEFREGERNVMLYILSRLQLPEKEIIEEVIDNG